MATDRERQAITSHLFDYGSECGFKPLAARDYGSRARNIDDPGSDYDVFFVFAQPPTDYVVGSATETYTKTITPEDSRLNTEIELHGWDLQRFIGGDGVAGSNPTAIEFTAADSEQYYWPDEPWGSNLRWLLDHARISFKPYALINHYRSLAASNHGKYVEGDYKLADGVSWDDLMDLGTYSSGPWQYIQECAVENVGVDENETTIDDDGIDLVLSTTVTVFDDRYDIDDALDRGLVEPTTTDRTVKRHLNIVQALIKARYIEQTHQCPTMDVLKLCQTISGSAWMPDSVQNDIEQLVMKKKAGYGDRIVEHDTVLHQWIEDELDRSVEPHGHVDRQPDTASIRNEARTLYEQLSWEDVTDA